MRLILKFLKPPVTMSLTQNWLEKGLNLYICTNIDYIYFSNLFFSLDFEDYKILMPSHPLLSRCDVINPKFGQE